MMDVKIDIDFECNECGNDLVVWQDPGITYAKIGVEPCGHCLEKAKDEGREEDN